MFIFSEQPFQQGGASRLDPMSVSIDNWQAMLLFQASSE
jgi:hypothetical protein